MKKLEEYAAKRRLTILKVYTTPGGDNPHYPTGPHLRALTQDENGKKVRLWFDPSRRPGRLGQRGWRKA